MCGGGGGGKDRGVGGSVEVRVDKVQVGLQARPAGPKFKMTVTALGPRPRTTPVHQQVHCDTKKVKGEVTVINKTWPCS